MLITGHLGYVGRNLNFPQFVGYDLVEGNDIRELYNLETVFEKGQFSTVIHLAALTGVRKSVTYPHQYISTNIEGTWNVVKMCEKYSIRKLIFFSSSSVYGNHLSPVTEMSSKNPISLYGLTKLAGEHIVNQSSIPTVIIRPFTVYPGRKDQVIYKWLSQIKQDKTVTVYGDETSRRGYTYVGDVEQVLKKLIQREWEWEHEDFNLGGSEVICLGDLLALFKQIFPNIRTSFQKRPQEDIVCQYTDIFKLRTVLGFEPEPLFFERVREILT